MPNQEKAAPVGRSALYVPGSKTIVLLCLSLFGLVLWVFWPSVHGTFLFYDESAYIVDNLHVNTGLSWANITWAIFSLGYANWHPVTWWSHMLDCQLFGLNPWGHHLTNILIHAANTVLVFIVFRKMTRATWASLIVALLFGLHPLRVASAAYVSERRDVLSLFFWMLTLWAYACFAEASRAANRKAKLYYGAALLFFALGLMSKTMVVTLPFVLLLLDHWPLDRWRQKNISRLVLEKVPFFILTFIVCYLAYIAQHQAGMMREMADLSLSDRLGNAVISYVRYTGKLFWPAGMCAYYPHPGHWPMGEVVGAYLAVIVVSLAVWLLRRRSPYLLTGWFWFVGTLVPVIGLVQLLSQSIADRYTYIPMLGLLLMLVWGLQELARGWKPAVIVMLIALAFALDFFATRTRVEISYYKDDVTLWSRAIAVTENNFHAHFSLGMILEDTDTDAAIAEFEQAVRINPGFTAAQNDLGTFLARKLRFTEAIEHYEVIIKLEPTNQLALFNCGIVYFKTGDVDSAIKLFQKLVDADPANAHHRDVLTASMRFKEETTTAVDQLYQQLRSKPNQPETLNDLAWLLATSPDNSVRNGREAVKLAKQACTLTQDRSAACEGTLAAAYAETKQFDLAIATVQKACQVAEQNGDTNLLQKNQVLQGQFETRVPYYEMPQYIFDALSSP